LRALQARLSPADYFAARTDASAGISLIEARALPAPAPRDIVLICAVYNAAHEIRQFLTHYRGLGVARFAFVDDGSDDGTVDILHAQDDVDLFTSNVDYGEGRDLVWRQMLVDRYGPDRWYVSVDSDEYLFFEDSERRKLGELARLLDQFGEMHLLAQMIDIYPDGPLGNVRPLRGTDDLPWRACPIFDGDGYFISAERRGVSIRGGPRYRLFANHGRLSKYPFFRADGRTSLCRSGAHALFPFTRNFVPVRGVLLHNKFGHGHLQRFDVAVRRQRHSSKAAFYRTMVAAEDFNGSSDLRYAGSRAFESSAQMVRLGFIDPSG